jgi:hypothetical protein
VTSLFGKKDFDRASETRQMAESDRRPDAEKAGSYALVIAILFVVIAVLIIVTR